jgi:RHS repeat-associated protein
LNASPPPIFLPAGILISNTSRGSLPPGLQDAQLSILPRSHANPTRSTRLPRESLRVNTGCCSSQLLGCYLHGDEFDQTFARVDLRAANASERVLWYLTDHLNSVRLVLDASGAILDQIAYDAFGNIVARLNPLLDNPILFASRQFDAETGLYSNRARYLDPTTGRWTTQDPLGFAAGDANLYRYVGNRATLATDPSGYSEQLPLWVQFVNSWDNVLGHPRTGWFAQISNGAAGMADTVSLELASRLRQWVGYDDVVDYHSAAYFGGQLVGTGVNLGLGFANPCAMGRTLGQGLRWLTGVQAVGGSINAGENLAAGNYGAAVLDLVGVAGNSFQMRRPCFPGDVQVLTRRGWVRWDALTTNDEVLSLPEDQPEGELAYRRVEEVFGRCGVIWEVAVGGRVLRTTAEHPFWVRGRGWTAARQLRVGDALRSHDGQWLAVEDVRDTGREEVVYNGRVAEYHTYFVGDDEWGFSLWAHNSCGPGGGAGTPGIVRGTNPSRVTFDGIEVRAVRDLSHLDESTLRAMRQRGFAARDINGHRLELHHLNQNPAGPLVEIPAPAHNIGNRVQHPFGNQPGAGLTVEQRASFNEWRIRYWQERAREELARRGLE